MTFLSKFRRNAGSSIGPTTLLVDPVDCFQKTSIRFISSRRSAIDPRVVATGGDTQQTAHGGDWIVGLIHFHEPEDFLEIGSLSRANQAAAFANISRSTLSCLFSLRNFRSSARSTVVRPSLRRPSSRSAWAIPVADRLFVGFKLSGQLTGSAPGSMKLDYLLAKLGWISSSCSWHRILHSPKGLGVHETGGTPPEQVVADAGYKSEENFEGLEEREIDGYISLGREGRDPEPSENLPATLRMFKKLGTEAGQTVYRRRKVIAEPVFGWVKQVLGFRTFSLRGLEKVEGEWDLVCLALNLKRMNGRLPTC